MDGLKEILLLCLFTNVILGFPIWRQCKLDGKSFGFFMQVLGMLIVLESLLIACLYFRI